jgi:hypothetical protein
MTKKTGRNKPCPCGSGRKYKHCCLHKQPNSVQVGVEIADKGKKAWASFVGSGHPGSDDEAFRAIFLGEGEEELTEDVIQELVTAGWLEADLRRFVTQGARYNRLRQSIIFPPEDSNDLGGKLKC